MDIHISDIESRSISSMKSLHPRQNHGDRETLMTVWYFEKYPDPGRIVTEIDVFTAIKID